MGTANTDTSRKDQQREEKRREEQRHDQNPTNPHNPNDERRQNPGRQNMEMAPGTNDTNPDSPPQRGNNSRNETPGNWQGENSLSGTSQAQKGQGQTPGQQNNPSERREHKREGGGNPSNPGKDFGSGGTQKKSAGA